MNQAPFFDSALKVQYISLPHNISSTDMHIYKLPEVLDSGVNDTYTFQLESKFPWLSYDEENHQLVFNLSKIKSGDITKHLVKIKLED